jgi:chemotaxis protein CheD
MKYIENLHIKRLSIGLGEYHVTDKNVILSAQLGSCVAACLYDPEQRIIGMNHFLLSNRRYAKDRPVCMTEAGRYGIQAMDLVINDMMKLGARRENLYAKAFGGGSILQSYSSGDNFFCVGEVNVRFIYEFFNGEGIPLISFDLGGHRGRVIHFHSKDFSVYVRKIEQTFNPKLVRTEKSFWQKRIESQENEIKGPEIR